MSSDSPATERGTQEMIEEVEMVTDAGNAIDAKLLVHAATNDPCVLLSLVQRFNPACDG